MAERDDQLDYQKSELNAFNYRLTRVIKTRMSHQVELFARQSNIFQGHPTLRMR